MRFFNLVNTCIQFELKMKNKKSKAKKKKISRRNTIYVNLMLRKRSRLASNCFKINDDLCHHYGCKYDDCSNQDTVNSINNNNNNKCIAYILLTNISKNIKRHALCLTY